MTSQPFIYEIDTWPWLASLAAAYGRAVELQNVPATEWDKLAAWGFDAVWLMGVWERSPAAVDIARARAGLEAEYRKALPDFHPADVVASPYSIHRYVVDPHLGGPDGLAAARAELQRRNIALVLDFVPNHVAIDHPWTREHPDYFIHEPDGRIANGRDPYFPPWTDTAQLNIGNPATRAALIETLLRIAEQCDAVRCDMAMLLLNEVFRNTWGASAGTPPSDEFWPQAISAVKARFPKFTLVAEVYWDLEATLLQQGFDYCYGKRLYDALLNENASGVARHLSADLAYQSALIRGLENHDEQRAAAVFPFPKHRAAAVIIATAPGAKLFHEGELEGRRIKVPIQLGRWPMEPMDTAIRDFYRTLLESSRGALFRNADWQLLQSTGWSDNSSYTHLIAYARSRDRERAIVVVNYSGSRSQGRIPVPWSDLAKRSCVLRDPLTSETFTRDGSEMIAPGLFVDLPPWGVHFLKLAP